MLERERESEWEGIEGSGGCNCRLQVVDCSWPEPGGEEGSLEPPFEGCRIAGCLAGTPGVRLGRNLPAAPPTGPRLNSSRGGGRQLSPASLSGLSCSFYEAKPVVTQLSLEPPSSDNWISVQGGGDFSCHRKPSPVTTE